MTSNEIRPSRQWRGVLHEYADRLDVTDATPVIRRMDTGGAGDACLSRTSSRTRIVEGVMW